MAKSAVFAPIPRVSVTTAARAKAGSRRKMRSAWRTSCVHMLCLDEASAPDVLVGDKAKPRGDER